MTTTKILTQVSPYADGGSVGVSFFSGGTSYTLIFCIDWDPWERKTSMTGPTQSRFNSAEMEKEWPYQWTSPTTGITYHGTEKSSRGLSWEESMEILRELEPQVQGFKSDYLWVFEEMLHVAANKGMGMLRDAGG